jgi:hypothetical protein
LPRGRREAWGKSCSATATGLYVRDCSKRDDPSHSAAGRTAGLPWPCYRSRRCVAGDRSVSSAFRTEGRLSLVVP